MIKRVLFEPKQDIKNAEDASKPRAIDIDAIESIQSILI